MNSENVFYKRTPGNLSRRGFLSACATCGACMAVSPLSAFCSSTTVIKGKMKIRVIYSLHAPVQPMPDWPNKGFDFNPFIDRTNTLLKQQFSSFEFIPTLAKGEEDAGKILSYDKQEKPDGYIVFQLNCWNKVVQAIATSGKPVLYVDFKYAGSGGFLTYNSIFLSDRQPNVGFVSSSREEDLIAAVKCFDVISQGGSVENFVAATTKARIGLTPTPGRLSLTADPLKTISVSECQRRMKESKILAVKSQDSGISEPVMGIPLEYISFAEVNRAWETADKDEAESIAKRWQKKATEVVDVPFAELQNSAAMYMGMKSVLKKHNANAITVNCLGGFYGNHIHAYPCLGFHELNNEGLIGACECDIDSTATMVAFTAMTQGRPGYISDPVIDTSKRQIIYAHCVGSNKVFGTKGPENPFSIMTHSEDRQGAAVRSILPVGYLTTTLKIHQAKKEIVFHQAKTVENDFDDRACRTKLCAEPIGDIEKLFTRWGGTTGFGWHRVTFYGDLKEPVYGIADALRWKVVEEA